MCGLHAKPARCRGAKAFNSNIDAVPFAIAIASDISGSQRIGVSPLIGLFLLALVLLLWVKPKGEQS